MRVLPPSHRAPVALRMQRVTSSRSANDLLQLEQRVPRQVALRSARVPLGVTRISQSADVIR